MPTTFPTPNFDHKNQLNITLAKSQEAYTGNIAYSITDNFGTFVGGSATGQDTSEGRHAHLFTEAGLIYYLNFDPIYALDEPLFNQVNFILGLGTGDSKGEFENIFEENDPNNYKYGKGFYNRVYLQVNISSFGTKNIGRLYRFFGVEKYYSESGLINRLAYVNFYEITVNKQIIHKNIDDILWEPAIYYKIGMPDIHFEFQLGFCVPLVKEPDINIDMFHFSIGLNFCINKPRIE